MDMGTRNNPSHRDSGWACPVLEIAMRFSKGDMVQLRPDSRLMWMIGRVGIVSHLVHGGKPYRVEFPRSGKLERKAHYYLHANDLIPVLNVVNIWGAWPGDESIEELLSALKEESK